MERKRPEDRRLSWSTNGAVTLYRDDLERIHEVLLGAAAAVEIDTQVYKQITTIEELAQAPLVDDDVIRFRSLTSDQSEVATVEIRLASHFLNGRAGVAVATPSDDLAMVGLVAKLRGVIEPRHRWRPTSALMWTLGGAFYALLAASLATDDVTADRVLVSGAYLAMTIWAALAIFKRGRRPVRLDLRRRSEAPSFIRRKRDDLLIAAASTVAGTGLGFLLGRLSS